MIKFAAIQSFIISVLLMAVLSTASAQITNENKHLCKTQRYATQVTGQQLIFTHEGAYMESAVADVATLHFRIFFWALLVCPG